MYTIQKWWYFVLQLIIFVDQAILLPIPAPDVKYFDIQMLF